MKEIKEVIVVEGRDDETAVKQAVKAEIIITHGYGIQQKTIERIRFAQERCGVIILTDPDFAGEKIRERLNKAIPGCKHAYISRDDATLKDDIGVENAKPHVIIEALEKAKAEVAEVKIEFSQKDLVRNDLLLSVNAAERRDHLGRLLGIGYGNGKSFLKRLNKYGISRQAFEDALDKLGE